MRRGDPRCTVPLRHENCPTRIRLLAPLSLDGAGDAGLRDSQHVDGDRVSGGDEADH